jgi:hypothetical protein
MDKAEFFRRLKDGRKAWEATLAEVGEARALLPDVVGIWSVKDLVAHILVWERWGAVIARGAAEGRATSYSEQFAVEFTPELEAMPYDPFNEWMVRQFGSLSYSEVRAAEQSVYEQFVAAVNALSDDDFTNPQRQFPGLDWKGERPLWDVLANQSYNHYRLHIAAVREWLKNTPSA